MVNETKNASGYVLGITTPNPEARWQGGYEWVDPTRVADVNAGATPIEQYDGDESSPYYRSVNLYTLRNDPDENSYAMGKPGFDADMIDGLNSIGHDPDDPRMPDMDDVRLTTSGYERYVMQGTGMTVLSDGVYDPDTKWPIDYIIESLRSDRADEDWRRISFAVVLYSSGDADGNGYAADDYTYGWSVLVNDQN